VDVKLPGPVDRNQIHRRAGVITGPARVPAEPLVQIGDEFIRAAILQERVRQKMRTAADKSVYLRATAASSCRT